MVQMGGQRRPVCGDPNDEELLGQKTLSDRAEEQSKRLVWEGATNNTRLCVQVREATEALVREGR